MDPLTAAVFGLTIVSLLLQNRSNKNLARRVDYLADRMNLQWAPPPQTEIALETEILSNAQPWDVESVEIPELPEAEKPATPAKRQRKEPKPKAPKPTPGQTPTEKFLAKLQAEEARRQQNPQ